MRPSVHSSMHHSVRISNASLLLPAEPHRACWKCTGAGGGAGVDGRGGGRVRAALPGRARADRVGTR
jgi:hypothetical protein